MPKIVQTKREFFFFQKVQNFISIENLYRFWVNLVPKIMSSSTIKVPIFNTLVSVINF